MTKTPLIQLNDVARTLGVNRVLNGINLSIQRGEITAIIGKSGSGKSVLLKHIIGLLEPDSGTIRFDGRDRASMSPGERRALKRKFSYVFQDTALFDFLNVYENVSLPLVERQEASPAEVNRRVRDKLHQLDLLFDEPTTGLDPIRKNAVHSMIMDYQQRFGFTGVVVSHEIPDIFFISQRVAMIDEGRIRFEGTPEEIQQASDPEVRNFIEGLESPRDELTGIATHSLGQKRLLQEMSRLQRHEIPFSIVMMAMANLEGLDRIAGHVAGQTVFKLFANHVTQNTYITDTCFRYDINKILVVLPDTDEQQARDFCRKISRTLENNALFDSIESVKGFCYSVSAGVAQARKGSGLEDLIAEAQKGQAVFYECRN
jgi:phospholipid/cholesterol/gamma-HCH transport system ATP-binding protein